MRNNPLIRPAGLFLSAMVLCALLYPTRSDAKPNWIVNNNEKHGGWVLGPVLGVMPWNLDAGARLGIPIAPSGFLSKKNDEVRLEIGLSFQMYWAVPGGKCECKNVCDDPRSQACRDCKNGWLCGTMFFRLAIPVMLQWEFYLTKSWSVYIILGAQVGVPFSPYYRKPFGPHGWAWIVFAFGAKYIIKNKIALRLEIGTLGLIVVGIDFTI